MSFAKPVLVSDATAQKKLIKRTKSGLIHRERDVNDFTNKVLELYNNKELRNELGNNGKSFIENEFCWERVSQNLVDIYDELSVHK
jgi:glycosyltransferase involved in cell wall biosynthesis